MSTSIKDVAKMAGVSTATVSRVLNQKDTVSETTRRRVLEAVKACNYVPNANAKILKSSYSKSICLLVRGVSNPYFAAYLRIIERQVSLRGYPLLMEAIDDSQDEFVVALRVLQEKKPQGLIFLGGTYHHTEEEFRQISSVPKVLVTFDAPLVDNKDLYSSIMVNDVEASTAAVEYLIEHGHNRIVYMAKSPFEQDTTGHMRMLGYKAALKKHDIPFDPSLVFDCEYSPSSGFQSMRAALALKNRVTAVYAAADTIAIGAAKAALSSGLQIPQHVSIIGFDGIEMAEYYEPALDSVVQPGEQMARESVELLFELIHGSSRNQHIVHPAKLMKRGSSGKAYQA